MRHMIQVRTIVLTACVMGMLAGQVPAQEAPAPAAVAATGPASAPAEAARPNWSEAAIELSEREKTALSAVRDGNTQLAETAFFMLLSRAGHMKPLSAEEFGALEQPSFPNLMAHPTRYRAQPIRLTISVFTMQKFVPSQTGPFPVTPHWPRDRAVWYLTALNTPVKPDREQPLMLYCVSDPSLVLGNPSRTEGEAAIYAGMGRRVEVAGLFYKIHLAKALGEDRQRDYPVVLAWQMSTRLAATGVPGAAKGEGDGSATKILGAIFVLMMVLAVAFLILRRRVRQLKSASLLGPKYKPLRDLKADEAKKPLPPEELIEVDPLLKQAAEQFKKEREGHDQHGSG